MRLRPFHRSMPTLLPLALGAVLLSLGCGDPNGGFSFESIFEPDEAVVEHREGETLLRMHGISFGSGSADLRADSLPVLDKFAAAFEAIPSARYSIEAHTASPGASADNLALSQDQARAVRDYLVGVVGGPPVAFTTVGHGEDVPIANNATQQGRALNRRIEIIVEDDPGTPIFLVTLAADRIDVVLDCDDFTSSASAAAGDFYIQTEIFSEDDRGRVLADRSSNTLVQLDAGESSDLAIVAQERFLTSDVAVLNGFVDWFENDSGGVHQFDRSDEINLFYDRGERCWVDLDAGSDCVADEEGEILAGTLSVFQPPAVSVDGCVASLDWSVHVERVAR